MVTQSIGFCFRIICEATFTSDFLNKKKRKKLRNLKLFKIADPGWYWPDLDQIPKSNLVLLKYPDPTLLSLLESPPPQYLLISHNPQLCLRYVIFSEGERNKRKTFLKKNLELDLCNLKPADPGWHFQ